MLYRDIGPLKILLQDKGQLDFNPWHHKVSVRNVKHFAWRAGVKHVVQQRAVVGLVDLAGLLHGTRRQANFVANDVPPLRQLQSHPSAANTITVFDGHAWKTFRKMLNLLSRNLCVLQFGR